MERLEEKDKAEEIEGRTYVLGILSDGTGRFDQLDWLASEVLRRVGVPPEEASGEVLREMLLRKR